MSSFFFFNDTATTEIYTLSLHDALPILRLLLNQSRFLNRNHWLLVRLEAVHGNRFGVGAKVEVRQRGRKLLRRAHGDRKSTRLNSSHSQISYAVFCLKKKNTLTLTCILL